MRRKNTTPAKRKSLVKKIAKMRKEGMSIREACLKNKLNVQTYSSWIYQVEKPQTVFPIDLNKDLNEAHICKNKELIDSISQLIKENNELKTKMNKAKELFL